MKVAHYIGNHRKDTLSVRLGWALTRLVQWGPHKHVTHSEAILAEFADGSVLIASSSARDGGVRTKRVKLNPDHWLIIDVPGWDVQKSCAWFNAHKELPYSWIGALKAGMPILSFLPSGNGAFCNQAVGAAHMSGSDLFTPAEFATICIDSGTDVTAEFFARRSGKP